MFLQISILALLKIFQIHKIRIVIEPVPDDSDEEPKHRIRIKDGGDNLLYYSLKLQGIVGFMRNSPWLDLIQKEIEHAYSSRRTDSSTTRDQLTSPAAD